MSISELKCRDGLVPMRQLGPGLYEVYAMPGKEPVLNSFEPVSVRGRNKTCRVVRLDSVGKKTFAQLQEVYVCVHKQEK